MYPQKFLQSIQNELQSLKEQGKFKYERELSGPMGPVVDVGGSPPFEGGARGGANEVSNKKVLMFASNNYLGLGNHPEVVKAAHEGLNT